jgi:SAM-dependent methyltransferase
MSEGAAAEYDVYYAERAYLCGKPSREVVAFFDRDRRTRVSVLDLGCGQGRHALMAARRGHRVLGIDVSRVGVDQMIDAARQEALDVRGHVADLTTFRPRRRFDVVLLDRVLHLLDDDRIRLRVLASLATLTRPGSVVLIDDVAANRDLIRGFFVRRTDVWRIRRTNADFLIAERRAAVRRGANSRTAAGV